MLRWLRRILIAFAVLIVLAAAGLYAALRDNPARPALGERRVAVGEDARIHYFESGPTSGLAIALLPSFARSASDFNELARALNRAGYRTLAMQPRGVDGSELPSLQTSLHTYAADLAAVLDTAGVSGEAVVIGHAYGNRVARTFASDFPERTRALILLAAGGSEPTPPEAAQALGLALLRILPETRRREAIDLAFFAEGNPVAENWIRGWYPLAGVAEQNASAATPYAEWGAGGGRPILILQPAEDALAPGGAQRLRDRFPDRVELIEIPGSGHAILPEQPARIEREILRYLASTEAPA